MIITRTDATPLRFKGICLSHHGSRQPDSGAPGLTLWRRPAGGYAVRITFYRAGRHWTHAACTSDLDAAIRFVETHLVPAHPRRKPCTLAARDALARLEQQVIDRRSDLQLQDLAGTAFHAWLQDLEDA